MVQRLPSELQVLAEQRYRLICLCVSRILILDSSVSCYWYRRHRTLWRQWWIWPSTPSPLLWNLTTVHGSVTANFSFTNCEVSSVSYIVALIPNVLSSKIRECWISQLVLKLLVCQYVSTNVVFLFVFH